MATIRQIVTARLERFGIELQEIEVDAALIEAGLEDGSDEFTADSINYVKKAIVTIIPDILLYPQISEGGYSKQYNVEALKTYYGILCGELGIENKLTPKPKVVNGSNLW